MVYSTRSLTFLYPGVPWIAVQILATTLRNMQHHRKTVDGNSEKIEKRNLQEDPSMRGARQQIRRTYACSHYRRLSLNHVGVPSESSHGAGYLGCSCDGVGNNVC